MGNINSVSLLSREESERIRLNREASTVYWFIGILTVVYFGFGIMRTLTKTGLDLQIGYFELFLTAFLVINAALYKKHRRADIIKPIMSSLTGILCLLLLFSGGTSGTGIFWSVVLQSTNCHFLGRRAGSIFSAVYTAAFLAVGFGARYIDSLQAHYTTAQLIQCVIVLATVFFLSYATRRAHDIYADTAFSQREQMQIMLESIPVGIIYIVPPDGRLTIVNSALEQMIGQNLEDNVDLKLFVKQVRMAHVGGAPFSADETALGKALKSGNTEGDEQVFITRPDGNVIVTRLAAAPIKNASGQTAAVIGVFEDMTKENEINNLKTELVSLASHQMKTPLTAIRWSVEALVEGSAGKLNDDQLEIGETVLEIIKRMMVFIGDLLNISRIDTGRKFRVNPEPTDVIPIIRSIADEQKFSARQKQVTVSLELPESLRLMADEGKFRELFSNLVSNAIKYSKDNGQVTVTVEDRPPLGQLLVVKDDGIGIPKNQHDKIFGRFFRADNVGPNIEGTGLGLNIAKEIVDRHGGSIWFESEEGKGTSFFVSLKPTANGEQS